MTDRKRINVTSRSQPLHIEAPGCIVNITHGLRDSDGREVTSVEILCDADFKLPDHNDRTGVNVRVVRAPW